MLSNENTPMSSFWSLLEGSFPSSIGSLEPDDLFPLALSVVIDNEHRTDQEQSL